MPEVIEASAKINLFLEVLRRREDGFHDILSVFQEIGLADRLQAWPLDGGEVRFKADDGTVPTDESNPAVKAVRLLQQEAGVSAGIEICLYRRASTCATLSPVTRARRVAVLSRLREELKSVTSFSSEVNTVMPWRQQCSISPARPVSCRWAATASA